MNPTFCYSRIRDKQQQRWALHHEHIKAKETENEQLQQLHQSQDHKSHVLLNGLLML